jgi:hypothetical protein
MVGPSLVFIMPAKSADGRTLAAGRPLTEHGMGLALGRATRAAKLRPGHPGP